MLSRILFGKIQYITIISAGKKLAKICKVCKKSLLMQKNINLGNIIEKGYVSDYELSILYQNSKGLIYPSKYEGFGLPPLEAMNHGCPVLTTPYSSIPEVCEDAGVYVDCDSYKNIAYSINTIINDQEKRGKYISLSLVQSKKFNWANSAKQIIEICERVNNINI